MLGEGSGYDVMHFLSWNVQGLGGPLCKRYRSRLRKDLKKCLPSAQVDIILIQEHHLNASRISQYGTFLAGAWEMFWSAAVGHGETQGGVCIAIADRWKDVVIQK